MFFFALGAMAPMRAGLFGSSPGAVPVVAAGVKFDAGKPELDGYPHV